MNTMKTYRITFVDVIKAENIDEAYDDIRKMCRDIGEDNDVTPFEFEEVATTNPEPCNMDEDGVGCRPKDNDR